MLKPYIKKLISGQNLSEEESYAACQTMLTMANPEQIAAFLVLLSRNGETVDELVGLVKAIKSDAITVNYDSKVVDIVGTGGDNSGSVNISTASSLLVSACGVPVIKHGNRGITSNCGSADVLDALWYSINLSANDVVKAVKERNFAFCFAPNFYPALAKVRDIREHLGVVTLFNLLGPLLNPANAQHIVLGVYDKNR